MKISIKIKQTLTGNVWNEEYDIPKSENPEEWSKDLLRKFNLTLRQNESPREFISVSVLDADGEPLTPHKWRKQNLVTIVRGSSIFDIYECEICGVTGKRHGLSDVAIDAKFKANAYRFCETAKEQFAKNEQRRKKVK